jgi:hypothetical protein
VGDDHFSVVAIVQGRFYYNYALPGNLGTPGTAYQLFGFTTEHPAANNLNPPDSAV